MAYADEVLADSPKGYWKLGDTSGTTAVDSSGNSHDGTYGAGVEINQAGGVNGTDKCIRLTQTSTDYVSVADHADFDPTTAVSIEAWVYSMGANGNQRIVQKTTDDNGPRIYWNGGSLVGRLRISGTNREVSYAVDLNDWAWHHVVLTWADSGTVKLWLDKVKVVESGSTYTGTLDANTASIEWGRKASGDATGDHWNGYMDEVAWYNTELSSTRIAAHYDNIDIDPVPGRVSQVFAESVMEDTSPALRVTQVYVESVQKDPTPTIRVTQAYAEVVAARPPADDGYWGILLE